MRISEVETNYLSHRAEQGFATATVKNDRQALGRLVRAVGDIEIKVVTHLHIDRVLGTTAASGLSAGTLNSTQSSLSAFFKYCAVRGIIEPTGNPMVGRRWRPNPKKARVRIPIQKFNQLLDAAHTPRDRMVLAIGLFLLLRQGEATQLRIKDVDLDEGYVRVIVPKTNDFDEMPITTELDRELRTWLLHYQTACGPLQPNWYLTPALRPTGFQIFSLTPERRITKSEDIIRRSLTNIGVEGKQIGMHTLRRSAARAIFDEMCERGVDGALRKVAAWCHHSSVRTTEIYLGLDVDQASRNKDYRNQPMYPSLAADNVVQLRSTANGNEADEAV